MDSLRLLSDIYGFYELQMVMQTYHLLNNHQGSLYVYVNNTNPTVDLSCLTCLLDSALYVTYGQESA